MLLHKIQFKNFRNLESTTIELNPLLTVIIGENARGKTNCLEGIFFLINGTGFRESRESELIRFDEQQQASVDGLIGEKGSNTEYKIVLTLVNSTVSKAFYINKSKKRFSQYVQEQTKAVLFAPEQIEILTGPPDKRRSYFNKIISFYDLEYKKRLDNYEQAIRRRNKILEHFETLAQLNQEISFWNTYCLEQSAYLTKKRAEYVAFLNKHQSIDGRTFGIDYERNEFSQEHLDKYSELETKTRRTMFGPQKDDFQILELHPQGGFAFKHPEGVNIQHFGSRSEQRLALLWLKLGEIRYYEEVMKRKPIILLDDVFSEFDSKNKKLVLDLIKHHQTVATTTDKEILDLSDIEKTVITL